MPLPPALTSPGRRSGCPTPWPRARDRNTRVGTLFCRRRHAGRARNLGRMRPSCTARTTNTRSAGYGGPNQRMPKMAAWAASAIAAKQNSSVLQERNSWTCSSPAQGCGDAVEKIDRAGPDRLADPEASQVVGQRLGARRSGGAAPFPGTSGRPSPGRAATRGCKRRGATGSSERTCSSVSSTVAAWNGGRPVSSSYRIAPRAYTSVAGPTCRGRAAPPVRGPCSWACPRWRRCGSDCRSRRRAAWPGRSR